MAAPESVGLVARRAAPLEHELAESRASSRSSPSRSGAAAEQALVEQGGERVEGGIADELRRLERAAASEHAEAREEHLLVLVEHSYDQAIVALSVRWRSSSSRVPFECVEPVGEAVEEQPRA